MNGKGDKRRPTTTTQEELAQRWKRTFGKESKGAK